MKNNGKREVLHPAEESNVIVDRKAPGPTDMLSEFVEETIENIQHLFDHEDQHETNNNKKE